MHKELKNVSQEELAHQSAITYINEICAQYGMCGTIISNSSPVPESDLNRDYILAGYSPSALEQAVKDQDPRVISEIIRKEKRSDKFFHPHVWAYDLGENSNQMHATEALVNYCKKAEFIYEIYSAYETPVPEVIRTAEVTQLMDAWDNLHHPNANPALQSKARSELDAFFKRENNPAKKEWLNYYRSDRFPDGKGSIAKAQGFLNRREQVVDMDQLMEFNGDIRKLEMQEHEFHVFREIMAELHPEVTYSVGKKIIVDHGLDIDSGDPDSPFGHSVSGEEYAMIRKQRFAKEGWDALKDLKMAYWEFRDVCFRDVDEPIVASIYNKITLEYARSNPLSELRNHGAMHLTQITASDFMNFVSLAKANDLRFYIDADGLYSVPSLEHVNVLYNEDQADKIAGIIGRMMSDKVNYSHMMDKPPLQNRIESVHCPPKPASQKRYTPGRD